ATWYYTPVTSTADFRALSILAPAQVHATANFIQAATSRSRQGIAQIHLENTGKSLAFLIRLKVTRGKGGEETLPVFWPDNYFELFPGESRDISTYYDFAQWSGTTPALEVTGWNIRPHP